MTNYKIISGPFEGLIVDDSGLWLYDQSAQSYDAADNDLRERFDEWRIETANTEPVSDAWETWINSWESEEIED